MTKKLFIQAITKFLLGLVLLGVLLFLPAGTLRFKNAWILIAVLFIPMFAAGVIMMLKDPELLKKRLSAKESEGEQKTVVALSGLMFIASFVIAGLNYRFGWMRMPSSGIPRSSAVCRSSTSSGRYMWPCPPAWLRV